MHAYFEAVRAPFEALLQATGGAAAAPLEGGWEGAKEAVDVALNALRQVRPERDERGGRGALRQVRPQCGGGRAPRRALRTDPCWELGAGTCC